MSLDAELDTLPEPVRPAEEDPEAFAAETFGDVRFELEDETLDEEVLWVDL